jgi:ABC-type sugar transport system permease subunit
MYTSYAKRNEDPLYASPALETLAILVMAPVLMAVDVSFTWIRKYKEYKQEKQDNIF